MKYFCRIGTYNTPVKGIMEVVENKHVHIDYQLNIWQHEKLLLE